MPPQDPHAADASPPTASDGGTEASRDASDVTNRWLTVPNALSVFRWVGAFGLLAFAAASMPKGFVVWYFVLALSDWFDGKIAVHFHQRSRLGPRLDSLADVTLYGCLAIGSLWLWHEAVWAELPWILVALAAGIVATGFGLWKFGRWPSYHTRSAKVNWGFMMVAVVCIAWEASMWPLRIAMITMVISNIESILITWRATRWHEDVIGIWALARKEREATDAAHDRPNPS